MKGSFHTHTYRCLHAYGTENDYVDAAVESGLDVLGFSDHGPFPDKDYGLRMKYEELDNYIDEINKLKNKYIDRIRIYSGLEIEFHPKYFEYYNELLSEHMLDYLALGEHTYTTASGEMKNIFFAEKTSDYVDYAESIAQACSTGLFAFAAHPDIMFINTLDWDKNCDKACGIILCAAEKYNIPLEFNANGVRRGKRNYPDGVRYPYPHERFWKQLSGSSQRVIVGSDAHTPEQLFDSAVEKSYELCKAFGLNVITDLWE